MDEEDGGRLVPRDFVDTTSFGATSSVWTSTGVRLFGSSEGWSFGTVVRNPLNEHVVMVIRDMGETHFMGMVLSARQQGNVLRLRRGSWNPVED